MNGFVARLMSEKRFGFIRGDDGHDYFFHMSDYKDSFEQLIEDTEIMDRKVKVTFDAGTAPKGLRASNVSRLDA